jgi:hypothetical protein
MNKVPFQIMSERRTKTSGTALTALTVLFASLVNLGMAAPLFRISLKSTGGSADETVVYYQSGATAGFDSEYDAYKLFGPNPAPHIAQEHNGILIGINGINIVQQTFTIDLLVTTPFTSTFTISASDFNELPEGTTIYVKDRHTGKMTNLMTEHCEFVLQDSTSAPRFVLYIYPEAPQEPTVSKKENELKLINKGNKRFTIRNSSKVSGDFRVELLSFPSRSMVAGGTYSTGSMSEFPMNLQDLPSGLYILVVTQNGGIVLHNKILLQ